MAGFSLLVAKALSSGMGSSLKVETVAWGRHSEGLAIHLNTFIKPLRLRFILGKPQPASETGSVAKNKQLVTCEGIRTFTQTATHLTLKCMQIDRGSLKWSH